MRAILALLAFATLPALAEVGQTEPGLCKPFVPTAITWSQYDDGYFTICTVRIQGIADDQKPAWLRFHGEGAVPYYPWWFGTVSTQSETGCPATVEDFESYALYVLNDADERYCWQSDVTPCPPPNRYQSWVTNRLEAACGRCDSTQAPTAITLTPDSNLYFYVDLRLQTGATVRIGFEHDGERWEHAEQYGNASGCTGQLQTFVDFTLAILTAETCTAPPAYSPAEQAQLTGYISEVESFCWDNRLLHGHCSPPGLSTKSVDNPVCIVKKW